MNYEEKDYKVFELFKKDWALATAGSPDHYNSCTIGWGSMGTLWTRPGKNGQVITVYLHPGRYTTEFLQKNDEFTVTFFPKECRQALSYMGTHTGRTEDKAKNAGLTPIAVGNSVGFEEAELTFRCRKIYQHLFAKEDLAEDVCKNYQDHPESYPLDDNGDWQPHWEFIGEILEVIEK